MDDERIPIVLVEDHVGIAEALGFALYAQLPVRVAAHCDRVHAAIPQCRAIKPRLVIFDWRMAENVGIDLLRSLARELPETRWLLYTAYPSPWVVRHAVEAGCHGCVSKGASHLELITACRALLEGKSYFCPESTQALCAVTANRVNEEALNDTERKILRFVAAGLETKEISLGVGVSTGTVRNYMVQIRQKLGSTSMVNLAKYAIEHGLAPPD